MSSIHLVRTGNSCGNRRNFVSSSTRFRLSPFFDIFSFTHVDVPQYLVLGVVAQADLLKACLACSMVGSFLAFPPRRKKKNAGPLSN
jgi:hypothetical protein